MKYILGLLFLFSSISLFSQTEFISTWKTSNISTGSSANNAVRIPTNPAYTTYNYNINWGDGNTDSNVTGDITHTYASSGTYTIEISGDFPSIYFNNSGDVEKIIEILSWGNIQWQSMENAFYGCTNLNFDAIDSPDLSQATSLKNMFRDATSFTGIVNDWDVSTITDISGIFSNCNIFNRPVDNWTTNSVTDMSETFKNTAFNQPLDNWNTASVTNMKDMLYACVNFNQNINNWNVGKVTDMSGMFIACRRFNQPLNNWNVSQVTDMSLMFFRTNDFNQDLSKWKVGNVTNMQRMFDECAINYPMNDWDVSKVTNMSQMFTSTPNFNQPLNKWDVANVTNMSGMFESAQAFNQPINSWNVSAVTNMSSMFGSHSTYNQSVFNQPINSWNVSAVTNMSSMFSNNQVFNQNLNDWDVSAVINMYQMFNNTDAFNQPLNNWDVSNVTNMSQMFRQNDGFNQTLNSWDTSSLTNISSIFANNTIYNQSINNWNISKISNMSNAFSNASAFNQNLGVWDISNVSNMTNMLSNSNISQENYDNTLIAWSGLTVKTGINLGATNLQYCDALSQRQNLIDNHGWTITGDAVNCSYVLCTEITMPHASDTETPANSDIRWNPAPNATGYRVTIEFERNGIRNYVTINGNPANNYDVGNVVGVSFTNEFMANDMVFATVVPYNNEGPATGCQEISFTVVESWVNSPDAFKLTYDTRILKNGTTAANQLKIEANTGYPDYLVYDYSIDWGDGQYDNHVSNDITHTYLTPGIYTVSIIGDFPAPQHYYSNTDAIKLLSIDQWGTQVWQSMNLGFYYCENMEYKATDTPNLSNVTNMSNMFAGCNLFNGNINDWDVSNVTNMSYFLIGARSFNQPLNLWNVSNVENMSGMFFSCKEFNQPIGNWTTTSVTNTSRMFNGASVFNDPLNDWDVSKVVDMNQMFANTNAFNQPLNKWDVSQVLDMSEMFQNTMVFNQDIGVWDVSKVTDMSSMFSNAGVFNQPLNTWDVSSVTTTSSMFSNADAFNQPLEDWDVLAVTNMASMFSGAQSFNQDISKWQVTNVINMSYMFSNAIAFNQPLNTWDVNSVVNMRATFRNASVFNQPLDNWDVSAVANMTEMFEDASLFNQPINIWNVSSVTLMESMFEDAISFNQPLNSWNTAVVTNFEAMFKGALLFNEPLSNWNTGEALTMKAMFREAATFNQNIDSWNVSFVTTLEAMFNDAITYNQNMNSWNVASVTTTEDMFKGATTFNGDISAWNVRGVTTMEEMFSNATSFNQNLNNWRVLGVNNMDYMFREASTYNQTMNLWNLGDVSMRSTFFNATALNQYLGDWDVSHVTNMNDMLDNTALTRENYDNTLIAWSEQTLINSITLGAQGLPYCDAQEERQAIIDTYGWIFDQDVRDCPIPECTQLASPLNGDTNVPVNTNINWNAALFAQGYRLTVGTSPAGNDIVNNTTIINETSYEFASDFNIGAIIYVTIIPFNDEGDALGPCIEESFTISSNPATIPECTSLTEPLNSDTDVAVTTNLSWTPISNADGYKLTVGTSSGSNDILNNEDVGNVITYNFPTNLPEDSDIFVTITPYNSEGDASGCSQENFHTEIIPVPPTCTSLTSPLNQATDVAINTQLSWNAISNATGYLVIVGITSGGIEVVNNIDVGNFTTYDIPNDLQEARLHYVTIIPYNDEGDAMGCIEETFTTEDLSTTPPCTTLSTPLNNATEVDPSTSIAWTSTTTATGYKLIVGTTSGGTEVFSGDVGNVTTHNLTSNLPESTVIYVTVTPYNANGDALGCTEESFTTNGVPLCTSLISPLNATTNVANNTELEWTPTANTSGYKLTVNASSSTANNITNFNVTTSTTYTFANNFEQGETVTVTITPYNGIGDAIGCTSESFTIKPIPTCTTLSNPIAGAVNMEINSDITWNTVTDATGYKLTVTGSESTANNITEFNTTATTYNFANNFEPGETVTVSITPYNESGDAINCTSESFTIKPLPSCTNLIFPRDGATNVAIDTNIEWTTIAEANSYKLTVNASNSTANNVTDLIISNGNTYSFPNHFDQNETVSVTLIPLNTSGDAIGCNQENFETGDFANSDPPTCTNLINPLNNATDVSIETNLSWTSVNRATGYKLSIGTNAGANNILNNEDVGNITSYDLVDDLPETTTIFVTITPYNNIGDAIGCHEESFTTETLPTAPNCTTLSSPINNATNVDITTNLSWNIATDATGYKLSVGTNTGANNILNNEDIGNITSYNFSNNLPETTTIFVTIIPYNNIGDAIGCYEESFTTETLPTAPNCTTLIYPNHNAIDIDASTDITWETVLNADGYKISLGTTPKGTDVLNNIDVGFTTSYSLNEALELGTTYYINITPYNSVGDANSCSEKIFTTLSPPKNDVKYGFSPDGDGINDFWTIDGMENHPDNMVTIYNRWGDMVFQTQGYNNTTNVFKGIANKKTKMGAGVLPEGTYFFQFTINGAHNFDKLKGFVVIKR
ncbi:hypothetical protein GCM10022291_23930 [Postechiella marina]|uniref:PKD domain-containing protein n=1 Tax=Postechiella marina TaxID=943941 RepID=A0ABP8CBY6_9FLAO